MKTVLNQEWLIHEYPTRIGTFDKSSDQDWAVLEPLLTGIDALYRSHEDTVEFGMHSTYGRIARVELFHTIGINNRDAKRGAVIFDNRGEPLMHLLGALLGYGGAGPTFTKQVLTAIGVPEEMFDEVNQSVVSHDYDTVIFSREDHSVGREGTDTANHFFDVVKEWECWISA